MNADQHPALKIEPDDLPSLTLVLPGALGKDETLKGLVQAIGEVRTGLGTRVRQFQQLTRDHAASGDQLRQALCRGQSLGFEVAALAIDEAIVSVFGLWDQYEAQDPDPEATSPRAPGGEPGEDPGNPGDARGAGHITSCAGGPGPQEPRAHGSDRLGGPACGQQGQQRGTGNPPREAKTAQTDRDRPDGGQ